MSAITLAATICHGALAIGSALIVAFQKVGALTLEAAPRETLKVIITVVVVELEAM